MKKTIIFETSDLYTQDGAVEEYEIGKPCNIVIQGVPSTLFDELHIENEEVAAQEFPKVSYSHIKESKYDIIGFVYRTYHSYAFMDVGYFNIVICNGGRNLEEGKYYTVVVDFIYDIWDCYHLEMYKNYPKPIDINGVTKRILVDTSKYDHDEVKNVYTKENVPKQYTISLEKTSCWDDRKYSNSPIDYLVEVEIEVDESDK